LHALRPFTAEVAAPATWAAIGRGEDMEITTYLEAHDLELQGNVSDLCPCRRHCCPRPQNFPAVRGISETESVDVHDRLARDPQSTRRARSDPHLPA